MCPKEFWILYHGKISRQPKNTQRPTDAEYDEMLELLNKAEDGE